MPINSQEFQEKCRRQNAKKRTFILAAVLLIILLAGAGIAIGSADISVLDAYRAVYSGLIDRISQFLSGSEPLSAGTTGIVVWDIRLHRVLFAVAAGFGLAIAGTVMQGILRNPLASPFTLGIASAASCGASVAIILFGGIAVLSGNLAVILLAFIFAMLASFGIYAMSKKKGLSSSSMILAGIALMYLFSAITSLLQYFGSTDQAAAVVYWMFGSLDSTTWAKLGIVCLILAVITPYLVYKAWDLNALAEGDEIAKSIGVPVERSMTTFMFISSVITAVIIAFTGTIGFIGLVAPHMTRMVTGSDHRILIPASGLVGAAVLLAADDFSRIIIYPSVIPVGIMTAFLGVPFFLYLFLKRGDY
ncbi:iron complex transport system permease protein [Methanomicrobium sp. W14]|uniref:FecCD family ABC transporter permease n=1 Tax=Methanomicrobium sp. W14 TaxID=2817839 RepID=UPI001AE4B5EB|nr:iron ABC transporter permease [Methanomicrobium sp. W14]MBP2134383.1 iron complex transport system permease protein [Methanomicrobium sp. W14]